MCHCHVDTEIYSRHHPSRPWWWLFLHLNWPLMWCHVEHRISSTQGTKINCHEHKKKSWIRFLPTFPSENAMLLTYTTVLGAENIQLVHHSSIHAPPIIHRTSHTFSYFQRSELGLARETDHQVNRWQRFFTFSKYKNYCRFAIIIRGC